MRCEMQHWQDQAGQCVCVYSPLFCRWKLYGSKNARCVVYSIQVNKNRASSQLCHWMPTRSSLVVGTAELLDLGRTSSTTMDRRSAKGVRIWVARCSFDPWLSSHLQAWSQSSTWTAMRLPMKDDGGLKSQLQQMQLICANNIIAFRTKQQELIDGQTNGLITMCITIIGLTGTFTWCLVCSTKKLESCWGHWFNLQLHQHTLYTDTACVQELLETFGPPCAQSLLWQQACIQVSQVLGDHVCVISTQCLEDRKQVLGSLADKRNHELQNVGTPNVLQNACACSTQVELLEFRYVAGDFPISGSSKAKHTSPFSKSSNHQLKQTNLPIPKHNILFH